MPASRLSRRTLPEQLSGSGSPPSVLLRCRGPVLIVSQMELSGPACGRRTSSGTVASCRSGQPFPRENCSSTGPLSRPGLHSDKKVVDTDRRGARTVLAGASRSVARAITATRSTVCRPPELDPQAASEAIAVAATATPPREHRSGLRMLDFLYPCEPITRAFSLKPSARSWPSSAFTICGLRSSTRIAPSVGTTCLKNVPL